MLVVQSRLEAFVPEVTSPGRGVLRVTAEQTRFGQSDSRVTGSKLKLLVH